MEGEARTNPDALPPLPKGWRVALIDDLCSKVTSGGTPLRSNRLFFADGTISWFKTGELQDGLLYESEEKITDLAILESSAKLFPPDTVLMAMYGDGKTITSLGILTKEAATNQACCAMIPNNAVCVPRFLFYALKYHRRGFIRLASGGAQRNLSGKLIRRFALNTPPLPEQRAIADTLGTLDDKIELNRRTAETLEEMNRGLFKSWFIDFDPVYAKVEGRQPLGMNVDNAALFPNELVDSELGPIPEGWTVEPLDTVANFQNGLALQRFRPEGDAPRLPVVKIAQLRTGRSDSGEWARSDIKPECVIRDGDVIFSWSGSLLVVYWAGGEAALNQHLFKVTSDRFAKWFCYGWVNTHLNDFRAIAASKATTMGHIRRHHLTDAKCVVPSDTVLRFSNRIFGPLTQKRLQLVLEARSLAELRNLLLPKLLTGEIRPKDAERQIEEVA